MTGKYIVRLDDACETMDVENWSRLEVLFDSYSIKPIVAVVPNNRDSKLKKNEFDVFFWDKVRRWQKKGWAIALHGFDHVYISDSSGIVPFNKKSEFAGLDLNKQIEKIEKGITKFREEKIETNIWIAPSHTFDENTLKALKFKTDIEIISDGVSLFPFFKYGFKWIPQQIWHFRKMPVGIWTSCFHPNEMSKVEFTQLENFIKKNHKSFLNILDLNYAKFSFFNFVFSFFYWKLRKFKKKYHI